MAYPRKTPAKNDFEVSDKIDPKRKEKLLSIKKREELKDVLISKFNDKHGSGSSVNRDMINEEVSKFISNADMSDANLSRLERRIDQRAQGSTATLEDDFISEYSGSKAAPSLSARQAPGSPTKYDWAKLDDYAVYIAEQDAAKTRENDRVMQKKIAEDLRKQIEASKTRSNLEKEEDLKYSKAIAIELDMWKEYERKVAAEKKHLAERERLDRLEQTEQQQARKKLEAAREAEEDRATLDRIAKEIAEEKALIIKRKEVRVKIAKRILSENELDKAAKEEELRRQHEEEVRIVHEYNEAMEKAQAQREAEAVERAAKQKALLEKTQWKVAEAHSRRADEDNIRAVKQAAEKEERAAELDRLKKERLAALQKTTNAVLERQVREKEEAKKREASVKEIFTQIMNDDSQEFVKEQNEKVMYRRMQFQDYKRALEAQARAKRDEVAGMVGSRFSMTDQEVQINHKLLEVVDRTLAERDSYKMAPQRSRTQLL